MSRLYLFETVDFSVEFDQPEKVLACVDPYQLLNNLLTQKLRNIIRQPVSNHSCNFILHLVVTSQNGEFRLNLVA